MLNDGFQYLEQRDRNNEITKQGIVSKESPFITGMNDGIYDVIAENFRWLYDNRGTGGGSGDGGSGSGAVGRDGRDGKSAYEIALKNGYVGSEYQWLLSLKGEKGDKGDKGEPGKDGVNATGKSVYEIAVENGFVGSEKDFVDSLKGKDGKDGQDGAPGKTGAQGRNGTDGKDGKDGKDGVDGLSAYEIAVKHGYDSSEEMWLESLHGRDGARGKDGKDGSNGKAATIEIGTITAGERFSVSNGGSPSSVILNFTYPKPEILEPSQGDKGEEGKSAYQIAVDHGYIGSEEDWLISLQGDIGPSAYDIAVKLGYTGTEKDWLESLKGDAGADGNDGQAATIKVGTVKTGDKPSVTNSGTEQNAILDFVFPATGGGTGVTGKDGRSAYEVAVDNGYKGTVQEWLASLKGKDGTNGKDGINGKDGKDGLNGKDGVAGKDGKNGMDAYDLAVSMGFKGDKTVWLNSLRGERGLSGANGDDGRSAYQVAAINGFTGTEKEWLDSLKGKDAYSIAVEEGFTGSKKDWLDTLKGDKGDQGERGTDGTNGKDGKNATIKIGAVSTGDTPSVTNRGTDSNLVLDFVFPKGVGGDGTGGSGADGKSAYELAVQQGYQGSLDDWLESLRGKDGAQGSQGVQGLSAYEVAKKNGYSGTESAWLASLKGEKGDPGSQGAQGIQGIAGKDGKAAKVSLGIIKTGQSFNVENSGTEDDAILDFTFPDLSNIGGGGGSSEPVDAVAKKETFDVVIKATDWVDGVCTVTNPAIEEDSFIFLNIDPGENKEAFQQMARACIVGGAQAKGSIKLKAMNVVPTYDISVQFGVF